MPDDVLLTRASPATMEAWIGGNKGNGRYAAFVVHTAQHQCPVAIITI
jgi:hypothetical protein